MKITRIIAFALVVLLVFITFTCVKMSGIQHSYDQEISLRQLKEREAVAWKDEEGKWRSKAESLELSNKTIRRLEKQGDKQFKELKKDFQSLKGDLKNLKSYTKSATQSTTDIKTYLHDTTITYYTSEKDTIVIESKAFSFDDSYTGFTGVITNDTMFGVFTVLDTLKQVVYWDRNWFLGHKRYFSEIKNANPNNKITYNEHISVARRPKRRLFR